MKSSKLITKSNKGVFLALLLLFVLLFSVSSLALSEDFNAFADRKELSVCACDLTTDHITVHNTGGITSTFIVLPDDKAGNWVDVAPQTFYLESGEIKTIERFIKVPCNARGKYVLNTTIRTLFDAEKALEQTLNVKNCPNVQIVPKSPDVQETCPCTPTQYLFEIINIGAHVETYELSLASPVEGVGLSTNFLILEPGQKETVTVFIALDCAEYGEKIFTLNALAQGTGILGQVDFALNINKCYDYDLIIGDEYAVCRGVENIVPFQLQNKAAIANEYSFSVDGPDWFVPENKTIVLPGYGFASSSLFVFPPADEEDSVLVSLSAISTRGNEEKNKEIVFVNELCYDYALEETDFFFKAAECKNKEHSFILKNTGSRETIYHVDLEGVEWLAPSTLSVELSPGEEAELVFSGDVPCGQIGDFAENIYITIDETNQTFLEERVFSVFPKENEFLPRIELSDLKISKSGGETVVKITNTGFSEAYYDLSLKASNWLSLDQNRISLPPGGNTTVLLTALPPEDVVEDVFAGELVVSLPEEGLEYSADFLVEIQERSSLLWVIFAGSAVLLLLVLLILFLVLFKKKKKPLLKKEPEIIEKETVTISKREYVGEKKEKKAVRRSSSVVVFIILLLFALGLVYNAYTAGFFGNTPFSSLNASDLNMSEVQKEKIEAASSSVQYSPLLALNRSGVAGSENRIEVSDNNEFSLPLTAKNPFEKTVVLSLNSPDDSSWVVFEKKKAILAPQKEFITNIKIKPDLAALKNSDHEISVTAEIRGEDIDYEEQLKIIIASKKSDYSKYWPVLAGFLVLLGLLAIVISISSGRKKEEGEVKLSKTPVKETKKEKRVERKEKRSGHSSTGYFIVGLLIFVLLILIGIWFYKIFLGSALEEKSSASVALPPTEDLSDEENKITNADVEEALITIDRRNIGGSGNVFALSEAEYVIPLSIKNPTDRIAKFYVTTTANDSWLSFDRMQILVGPLSSKNISLTLTPDYSALEKKEYSVYIAARLAGSKIDYNEEITLVLKKKSLFDFSYILYLVAGIVFVLLAFIIVWFMKKNKKNRKKDDIGSVNQKNNKKAKSSKLKTSINLRGL
jgi:quinol-cytochrome oxidoreductase complex cytochrome b subunit